MTAIKAIETKYKGYRFRSRLEARWAVFFNAIGWQWEYEKEGYDLPSGKYLPDFWISTIDSWVEIKGESPGDGERLMATELAIHTGKCVYILSGNIPEVGNDNRFPYWVDENYEVFTSEGRWDNFQAFCVCDDCGFVGIEYEGRSDRLQCKECELCFRKRKGWDTAGCWSTECPRNGDCKGKCCIRASGDKGHNYDHKKIIQAAHAARSARFEHGETPR